MYFGLLYDNGLTKRNSKRMDPCLDKMHPHRFAMKFRARGSAVEHVRHVEQKLVSFFSATLYALIHNNNNRFSQDVLHHPNAFLIHELYVTDFKCQIGIMNLNYLRLRKVTRKSI